MSNQNNKPCPSCNQDELIPFKEAGLSDCVGWWCRYCGTMVLDYGEVKPPLLFWGGIYASRMKVNE